MKRFVTGIFIYRIFIWIYNIASFFLIPKLAKKPRSIFKDISRFLGLNSRSLLEDGSRFLGLSWKRKDHLTAAMSRASDKIGLI